MGLVMECVSCVADVEVSLTVYPERSGSFIEGENVALTCDATNPPNVSASLTFVWGRSTNGQGLQPLMTNERFTITHEADYSILHLMNIQDDSVNVEGSYLCRVYNRLIDDSVTEMIDIDVICKTCHSCTCVHECCSWDLVNWRELCLFIQIAECIIIYS